MCVCCLCVYCIFVLALLLATMLLIWHINKWELNWIEFNWIIRLHCSPMRTFTSFMDLSHSAQFFLTLFPACTFASINTCCTQFHHLFFGRPLNRLHGPLLFRKTRSQCTLSIGPTFWKFKGEGNKWADCSSPTLARHTGTESYWTHVPSFDSGL